MNAEQQAPAVVVLGPSGLATARRAMTVFPQAELHGFAKRVAQADVHFDDTAQHLGALFLAGRPIIALSAAGIVIRCLAPHLGDKSSAPPVIALDEAGEQGKVERGDLILLLVFGAGLTWGAAIIEW